MAPLTPYLPSLQEVTMDPLWISSYHVWRQGVLWLFLPIVLLIAFTNEHEAGESRGIKAALGVVVMTVFWPFVGLAMFMSLLDGMRSAVGRSRQKKRRSAREAKLRAALIARRGELQQKVNHECSTPGERMELNLLKEAMNRADSGGPSICAQVDADDNPTLTRVLDKAA